MSGEESKPGSTGAELVGLLGAAAREAQRAARAVPGVRLIEEQAEAVQRSLLREVKRRLDEAGDYSGADATSASAARPPTVAETMRTLLRRSMDDTPDESRRTLHQVLAAELVPDEARILSALSDGSTFPMVHIAEPGVGSYQKRVLENASSVGRAAGVALPDRVPNYVSHLRRLGLVESGPEDPTRKDEYEILLTEPVVRKPILAVGKGPRGARVIRRTLRISSLGRELWEAAQSGEDVN